MKRYKTVFFQRDRLACSSAQASPPPASRRVCPGMLHLAPPPNRSLPSTPQPQRTSPFRQGQPASTRNFHESSAGGVASAAEGATSTAPNGTKLARGGEGRDKNLDGAGGGEEEGQEEYGLTVLQKRKKKAWGKAYVRRFRRRRRRCQLTFFALDAPRFPPKIHCDKITQVTTFLPGQDPKTTSVPPPSSTASPSSFLRLLPPFALPANELFPAQ